MGKNGDPEQHDPYKWPEGIFEITSNPQKLNDITAADRPDREVEQRLDAQRHLLAISDRLLQGGPAHRGRHSTRVQQQKMSYDVI
jgi:hypothetical protein